MKKLLKLSDRIHVILTDTSSLTTATRQTKPSEKVTSSNFQQGQTFPLPRMTSLTSAVATSSMSEVPSIVSAMSGIRLASSVADMAVIANLVPNRGKLSTKQVPCFYRVLI